MAADEPEAIRGWLLVFCLTATVNPLITVATLIIAFPILRSDNVPSALLALYYGLHIAIVGFGLYSALLLWTINRKAVVLAKLYLWAYAITAVLLAYTPLLLPSDMQGSPSATFLWASWKTLPHKLVYSAIWLAYLWRSRRVANTYAPEVLHEPLA